MREVIPNVTDDAGRKQAVLIPIAEWESIQERLSQSHTGRPIGELGLTVAEARETRSRLESFAQDWEAPGMDAYDHYDEERKALETR